MPLNDNQKRRLLSSFHYVDDLLSGVETLLASTGGTSPFSRHIQDIKPVQRKVVADSIALFREQMTAALKGLDIPLPTPNISGVWSVRTTLLSIDITLAELGPESMRGYGQLNADAEAVLTGLVAGLRQMLQRLANYLAEGAGRSFQERLTHLERTGKDVGLLQTLERIVTQHGLVEFRPPLDRILERLESNWFEIAVFGRVSSGKSTLLNHVLRTDALPVGVTPVTALPTHIMYGEKPGVEVTYADRPGQPVERAPIERLVDFVSEQGNPGNARHVTKVLARLPSPCIREGIVFVDTPGVGALSTSGAAEALAYLPHCDLGIVLIDAGSTMTPEEISLLRLLYASGIPAMVLISKCDLVSAKDLERMVRYVGDHFENDLGWSLPVYAVSAIEGHVHRLDEWFEREILPLYEQHQTLALASAHRKIGQLRDSVLSALRSLIARTQAAGDSVSEADAADIQTLLREAARRIEETRRRCDRVAYALTRSEEALIQAAARAIATQWREGPQADVAAALWHAVTEEAAPWGVAVYRAVQELRDDLKQTLLTLNERLSLPNAPDDFDPETVLSDLPASEAILPPGFSTVLHRPWWLRWLRPLWRGWAERRVSYLLEGRLSNGLEAYARSLRAWAKSKVNHLADLYDGLAGDYRFHLRQGVAAGQTANSLNRDELMKALRLLEFEGDGQRETADAVPESLVKTE